MTRALVSEWSGSSTKSPRSLANRVRVSAQRKRSLLKLLHDPERSRRSAHVVGFGRADVDLVYGHKLALGARRLRSSEAGVDFVRNGDGRTLVLSTHVR